MSSGFCQIYRRTRTTTSEILREERDNKKVKDLNKRSSENNWEESSKGQLKSYREDGDGNKIDLGFIVRVFPSLL